MTGMAGMEGRGRGLATRGLRSREAFEAEERERLAPWAVKSADSRGRIHSQEEHAYRTAFQRDRDRIVHSRAFRRLEYKTQVFVHHEGDHYRNRLTHTLEGGQIARSIARALRLNEELAEAVVLAHDLGHTPFGHAGERVLADLMKTHGDFDHNRQSLRIVDWLEERHPRYRGLNLTYETREGILKHGCDWDHPVPVPAPTAQPTLEAQVADRADEIAYTNHDVDDGLRSGLLRTEDLEQVDLWRDTRARVTARLGETTQRVLHTRTIAALIDRLVTDLLEQTAANLGAALPADPDAVRAGSEPFVVFSPPLGAGFAALKQFLYDHLYCHPRVVAANEAAVEVLGELFEFYRADAARLPERVRERFDVDGSERAIADYLAGMTDRFALHERERLLGAG
jgi:dGTPase